MKLITLLLTSLTLLGAELPNAPATTLSITNLNAHERFYVTYRAQKAYMENALAKLQTDADKEDLIWRRKVDAGTAFKEKGAYERKRTLDGQVRGLKARIAKLDVARLEYERRNPGADAYALSPSVEANFLGLLCPVLVLVVIVNQPTTSRPFPVRIITNSPARSAR